MKITLNEWLLLPFILWGVFQGTLFFNANMVEEVINIAIYEGSKKAAIQGRYTQDIYNEMIEYLESNHRFDPSKLEIIGTEEITTRGEYISIKVTVTKPRLHVISLFNTENPDNFYVFEKFIMSEYTVMP
jgi:hypothetical protein